MDYKVVIFGVKDTTGEIVSFVRRIYVLWIWW